MAYLLIFLSNLIYSEFTKFNFHKIRVDISNMKVIFWTHTWLNFNRKKPINATAMGLA